MENGVILVVAGELGIRTLQNVGQSGGPVHNGEGFVGISRHPVRFDTMTDNSTTEGSKSECRCHVLLDDQSLVPAIISPIPLMFSPSQIKSLNTREILVMLPTPGVSS